jgi:antitoxin VapB
MGGSAEDLAFPENVREVTVARDGDRGLIVPADRSWDDFFDSLGIDFSERDQPEFQTREAF